MLCSRIGVGPSCGNSDQLFIDNNLSLVHIEAGDKNVWAIDATNHIFRRPIDGSGEWSSIPIDGSGEWSSILEMRTYLHQEMLISGE